VSSSLTIRLDDETARSSPQISVKAIVEIGPLVALLNRADRFHAWARDAFAAVEPPLWTCEPVLVETCHLTGQHRAVLEMLAQRPRRDPAARTRDALSYRTKLIFPLRSRYAIFTDARSSVPAFERSIARISSSEIATCDIAS
jgi:hypothetical protein